MIENEIFKKSEFNYKKLIEYGFTKSNDKYIFTKNIINDSFKIIITIENNNIKGKIIDLELNDEYLNYRIENQTGEFSLNIRQIFIDTLKDIREKCCINNYYVSKQANRIADYISKKYNNFPEFLWDDEKNSVFRNSNNKKWYGIIMEINLNKITNNDKKGEVLNVKLAPEKIESLISKTGYYKAYHMNKKNWITIILDDSISDDEIIKLIDESYSYTIDTNEWVVPANPNYFDVISYMDNNETVEWKQSSKINIGDIVYLYVGSPYSAILYKTEAIEVNIPYKYKDNNVEMKNTMKLKILNRYEKDKYSLEILKKYNLTSIRGPRKMPKKLLDHMKENND